MPVLFGGKIFERRRDKNALDNHSDFTCALVVGFDWTHWREPDSPFIGDRGNRFDISVDYWPQNCSLVFLNQ